ncbi:GNAT family N-acetyltransferase [Mycobacterium sp. GA-2829]|uniref:GNAT family N-acetyltransferase n=1 Tax=Mycobacterium sp. GA-2829 TaxID=1772283 RepID=UPI0007400F43|nr:GNAT family N-acetyltransferase [Mycobacterium sp. GA-2829]KUI32635.1 acetyltransferase [Mycobacterium sp. GA-2829]
MGEPAEVSRGKEVPATAELLDGSRVTLREVTEDDRAAITALANALSEEERYLRFFTAHPRYIDEWVSSLVDTSPDRCTLVAYDAATLVGVANYTETRQPGCAEVALVVAHGQHHRGVGTVLLRTLGRIAQAHGQRSFIADVLADNREMHRVLSDSGWPCNYERDGPVVTVEVDLGQAR